MSDQSKVAPVAFEGYPTFPLVVLPEDSIHARHRSPSNCLVACALRRVFKGAHVSCGITGASVSLNPGNLRFLFPVDLSCSIGRFDDRREPFTGSFDLLVEENNGPQGTKIDLTPYFPVQNG